MLRMRWASMWTMTEFRIVHANWIFEKKTTIQPLFMGLENPFHPCAGIGWYGVRVIVPRERQGTTDLSAVSATVRGNCCVRWPGGSTDSGDYCLRSTILSNYLFTESEERTFSLLLGLYKYLFFKYCVKALSSAHL